MIRFNYIAFCLWVASLPSCYTAAKVQKVAPVRPGSIASQSGQVHSFRISGLPQMYIVMTPDPGFFSSKTDSYSQDELSKLRIYIKSLKGSISVNTGSLVVHEGEEREFELHKGVIDRNRDGSPVVNDLGKYIYSFSIFNVTKGYPRPDCDILFTIDDPTGLTRTRGIKLAGGFQDSL